MFSTAKKLLIMVELTVPRESRIDEAYERKKLKYSDLCDNCREKGWSVWCYHVEVGCRGFVGTSTIRALRQIGLTGKEKTKAVNEISEVAEMASWRLWLLFLFLFLFIYNPESHQGIIGSGPKNIQSLLLSGFPLLFSIRQWRVFDMPGTGPVHGTSSFTSLAKDILPLGEESVMTQPVNQ